MNIKLFRQLIALLVISCLISGCSSSEVKKLSKFTCNNNNYNINRNLYYSKDTNEIKVFFNFNISLLEIDKIELYNNAKNVCDTVEIVNQYDNILLIKLNEFVNHFNIIRLYDKEGIFVDFYIGDYYLQEFTENDDEVHIDFTSSVKKYDNYVQIYIKISEEIEAKYAIEFLIPKRLKDIFEITYNKTRDKDSTYILDCKITFKDKKQVSLFLKLLGFDVLVQRRDKKTNELNFITKFYIPIEFDE